jgi:hypothetical protein
MVKTTGIHDVQQGSTRHGVKHEWSVSSRRNDQNQSIPCSTQTEQGCGALHEPTASNVPRMLIPRKHHPTSVHPTGQHLNTYVGRHDDHMNTQHVESVFNKSDMLVYTSRRPLPIKYVPEASGWVPLEPVWTMYDE